MFSDEKSVYDYIRSIDAEYRDDTICKLYYLRDDKQLNKLPGFSRLITEMEAMLEIAKTTNYEYLCATPDPTEYLGWDAEEDFL